MIPINHPRVRMSGRGISRHKDLGCPVCLTMALGISDLGVKGLHQMTPEVISRMRKSPPSCSFLRPRRRRFQAQFDSGSTRLVRYFIGSTSSRVYSPRFSRSMLRSSPLYISCYIHESLYCCSWVSIPWWPFSAGHSLCGTGRCLTEARISILPPRLIAL